MSTPLRTLKRRDLLYLVDGLAADLAEHRRRIAGGYGPSHARAQLEKRLAEALTRMHGLHWEWAHETEERQLAGAAASSARGQAGPASQE